MSDKTYTHGMFVWRELITTDLEASRRFYGELLGWKIAKAATVPGMDYWEASAGDRTVAGMFQMNNPEMPANWGSYLSVPDVDAAAKAATASGGAVLNGPMEIPNVGRMATLRDPQGAIFSVFTSARGDSPLAELPHLGEFCWEQLNTSDVAGAKAFYPAVTGWKVLNGAGGMEVFGPHEGPRGMAASYMTTPPGVPSHWLTYVLAGKLTDANARATRLGARVLMERIEVPTIGAFSVIQDNVGAYLALFEPFMG